MKAERKILLRLYDIVVEIEHLEQEMNHEERLQGILTVYGKVSQSSAREYRKLRSKKEKKEKEYQVLIEGLTDLKKTQ